jgi:hypothetical protein
MWTSTATSLPKVGQKVSFAVGPMMYRSCFPPDGAWITLTGHRAAHWFRR